jgi:hypothetical protein
MSKRGNRLLSTECKKFPCNGMKDAAVITGNMWNNRGTREQ